MLEAAASGASHVLKNHKPIRCALAFEVAVLASPAELRRAVCENDSPRLASFASDPTRGDQPPAAWWESVHGGTDENETAAVPSSFGTNHLSSYDFNTTCRDLFVYVDSTSIGKRKDTRVRVQLREDGTHCVSQIQERCSNTRD